MAEIAGEAFEGDLDRGAGFVGMGELEDRVRESLGGGGGEVAQSVGRGSLSVRKGQQERSRCVTTQRESAAGSSYDRARRITWGTVHELPVEGRGRNRILCE